MYKIKFYFYDSDPKIFEYENFKDLIYDLDYDLNYLYISCSAFYISFERILNYED